MTTILTIGAHYDDCEIGCCETIRRHIKNGDNIIYAILNADEHRTGLPSDRRVEQVDAMKTLGLNPATSLIEFTSFEKSDDIIQKLDLFNADIIFSPWEFDTHQAHRRASQIGHSVGRKRHVTTYFYSSGSTYDFYPNIFNHVDFREKEDVLKCFKSQIECNAINIDIIKKREMYWGSMISTYKNIYAEGFIARKVKYKL